MKRFYKDVTIREAKGWMVLLDGRPIKTPRRADLALPTRGLAEAIADEWRGQGDEVKPASMPLTRLANTAIDRVFGHEADVMEKVLAFANDHLCYRAAAPADLAARQDAAWNPLLDWAAERHGARLTTTTGVTPITQPEGSVAALRTAVAGLDPFTLAGLHNAVTILGSLVLGLALADRRLTAEEAFALSQLDERYQTEHWGADNEAAARTRSLAAELAAAAQFMALSKG
jgi:chaperone required for assembly of F1-ATPase